MKEKAPDEVLDYPETPPWTMFFDGPLYQKYDEFMKTKDFSKILLATKLRLANAPEVQSSTNSIDDFQWDKQQEADPGSTYQYVPEDYYRRQDEDEKRRTRRTRAFILLGLVIMAAIALATGLVIHYIYIPSLEERNPVSNVNVSIFGNTSHGENIDETTTVGLFDNSAVDLLNILSPDEHTHDHDHPHDHGPRLSPDGKIFEDLFMNTTELPIDTYMETSTTVDETTKTVTTKSHKIVTAAKTTTTVATSTASKLISSSSSASTSPTTTTRKPTSRTTNIDSQTTIDNALYDIHMKPNTASAKQQTKPDTVVTVKTNQSNDSVKPVSSTMDIDAMDFFAMREYYTTTFALPKTRDWFTETTKTETTSQATDNNSSKVSSDSTTGNNLIANTQTTEIPSSDVTNFTLTAVNETESIILNSTAIETTTISLIPSTLGTSPETSTAAGTENPSTGTSEPSVSTEDPLKPTQTDRLTVGLSK